MNLPMIASGTNWPVRQLNGSISGPIVPITARANMQRALNTIVGVLSRNNAPVLDIG